MQSTLQCNYDCLVCSNYTYKIVLILQYSHTTKQGNKNTITNLFVIQSWLHLTKHYISATDFAYPLIEQSYSYKSTVNPKPSTGEDARGSCSVSKSMLWTPESYFWRSVGKGVVCRLVAVLSLNWKEVILCGPPDPQLKPTATNPPNQKKRKKKNKSWGQFHENKIDKKNHKYSGVASSLLDTSTLSIL